MTTSNGGTLVQSVERALSILNCFTDSEPQLRVGDLARRLGLPQSTVSRLLTTMEALEFIERDPLTGMVRPGLQLVTLAGVSLNQIPVQRQAQTELSLVASELGLAANLAILRDDEIFYLTTFQGPKAPKQFTMIGKRNPVHCTAIGKTLLAYLPDDEREALLQRIEYPRHTPYTASSPDQLRSMLALVRQQGYATEREELALGRACVAAPIRDSTGKVIAAASISGPLSALALDRREPELVARVIEMTDRISWNLGWVTVSPTHLPSHSVVTPAQEPSS
jgi:DNA-binding IclR family transcriptional regulator